MIGALIIAGLVFAVGWSLVARRLIALHIAPALVMVTLGIVAALVIRPDLGDVLYQPKVERAAEVILAVLLFLDATEVRGGPLGREPGAALRLLFVALPLSLLGAVLLGAIVFPDASIAVLILLACTLMPTDMSSAGRLFHTEYISERLRGLLNIESGYNDGIVAPLFIFALAAASHSGHESGLDAVGEAAWAAVIALVVGGVVGGLVAVSAIAALRRELTDERVLGITLVLAAILSYSVAVGLHGNGFIAAFVCGVAYRSVNGTRVIDTELRFVENVGVVCNLVVWFTFGAVVVYLFSFGVPGLGLFVIAFAALTVLRAWPVLLSLLGTGLTRRERIAAATLGTRGTASIVFALLAWNKLGGTDTDDASIVLFATAVTVSASVFVFGVTAMVLGRGSSTHPSLSTSSAESSRS